MNIPPDFRYNKRQDDTELLFVHRKLGNADIYWVNNRNDRVEQVDATFRVSGKIPEIWHPETGKTEKASYKIVDGQTIVPLNLEPGDAVFVVFRTKARKNEIDIPQLPETKLATISGPWDILFQSERGAPAKMTLEELTAWNENADPGVKYFSGTATYLKTTQVPSGWLVSGTKLYLDLGDVKNLAEVIINGKSLGILWKKPFRVEVTGSLKEGENTLELKVTNLWVNRLIGDRQPEVINKITYTTQAFYEADSPLLPSGLIGPVQIISLSTK
jgi:hypothetical protein